MKECRKCGKTTNEFYKDKYRKDGLSWQCKECESVRFKKYYNKNKTKRKNYHKKHRQELNGRYSRYKGSAKNKKLKFELNLKQFESLTSQLCFYCGKYTKNKNFCGIDRVDNCKGYVLKNCVSCCSMCNSMKTKLTHEEFLAHIQQIYIHSFKDFYEVWEANK